MENLLNELSQDLQNTLKDFKVSFVGVDEEMELNTRSEWDLNGSHYEAIEEELRAKGLFKLDQEHPTAQDFINKIDAADLIDMDSDGSFNQSEELEVELSNGDIVIVPFNFSGQFDNDSGDYWTPPSSELKNIDIDLELIVFEDEGGKEWGFTDEVYNKVHNAIKNTIS